MDIAELKSKLNAADIQLIPLNGKPNSHNSEGFDGTLDEYISILKKLAVKAVFVRNKGLQEKYFLSAIDSTESPEDDDGSEDHDVDQEDEVTIVDLCSVEPGLEKFKKYIGKTAYSQVNSTIEGQDVDFYLVEDWWQEFLDLRKETVATLEENQEAIQEKIDAENDKKSQQLLGQVRDLIDDQDFIRLPTLRAMIVYACDKIQGLDEIDEDLLKDEVRDLKDKIVAKGLKSKR